ncbi:endogenous retrovirus group S71 member 1 Env polyprotein-like [Symphalangus syndactylus]|uniref:endogenous retrovirus group S71 member 1 Env polyprotein-like n=1 Tax=Symphalangus syndactylus TaxID=9590 RepID=UPI0024418F3B|nr:endogenous retrovirus group S71 member 1 Env polyprotein-like [Symphalangus syndactylus]
MGPPLTPDWKKEERLVTYLHDGINYKDHPGATVTKPVSEYGSSKKSYKSLNRVIPCLLDDVPCGLATHCLSTAAAAGGSSPSATTERGTSPPGRVFANTTWRAGTSKEVTFAVDLCALFPEPARTHEQHNLLVIGAESVDLAAGFGHSGSQTGCGISKGAEKELQNIDFYLCPGNHPDASCRDTYQFFCPDWTYVTLATYFGGSTRSSFHNLCFSS